MQATFTYDLAEFGDSYRKRLAALPRFRGTPPIDTSGIEVRTDEQIQRALIGTGQRNSFEINHWLSLVSWSRDAGDRVRIVVEEENPDFETACRVIASEFGSHGLLAVG
jgi:hypothetical protein